MNKLWNLRRAVVMYLMLIIGYFLGYNSNTFIVVLLLTVTVLFITIYDIVAYEHYEKKNGN